MEKALTLGRVYVEKADIGNEVVISTHSPFGTNYSTWIDEDYYKATDVYRTLIGGRLYHYISKRDPSLAFALTTALMSDTKLGYVELDSKMRMVILSQSEAKRMDLIELRRHRTDDFESKKFQTVKHRRTLFKLFDNAFGGNMTKIRESYNETLTDISESLYKMNKATTGSFEILSGEDIIKAYRSKYADVHSCMRDKCPESFELYVENAEIIVFKDHLGMIIMRAILWEGMNGIKYADRLYSKYHMLQSSFDRFLEDNNIIHIYDDTSQEIIIELCRDIEEYSDVPYLDTFKYAGGRFLQNFVDDDMEYFCQNTNGTISELEVCKVCGDVVTDDNGTICYDGETYCEDCRDDELVWCQNIDEYVHRDDEDIFYCEDCGDWFYKDEHLSYGYTNDDSCLCGECLDYNYVFVESEDCYYPSTDVAYCETCYEYHIDEDFCGVCDRCINCCEEEGCDEEEE